MASRVWLEGNSAGAVLLLLLLDRALVRWVHINSLWFFCPEAALSRQLTTNTLTIFLIKIMKAMWAGPGSVLGAGVARNRSGEGTGS